ncbi:hypothetical protein Kpol_1066p26 [Vanderwaltozyma polyspora DSM 70294]|uniref:Uncharacterized protein n=1 Tax=Vanderwaltozyma polyspora (strain ATCC 22028 / DSM 70294 / BCRC 21397 / CBS 2163 / NBRC 10782 / NRRL Y-8283 / UCD 57-17) TaxID=436907 RepID=A7TMP7_VANPO|nr:uncharacterized protein Kpol_1066p26 [Vanderwaltozyma polyspora DSM 70294]EDO16461.1 hypothetical protein Kpol_1066p26 [Vanderwaltozyma polyspora DSM 70294]
MAKGNSTIVSDAVQYDIPPPDKEELELASIVFGDSSGFQSNLSNFDLNFLLNEREEELDDFEAKEFASESEDENMHNDMNNINDDQLFFIDDGETNEESNKFDETSDKMDLDDSEGESENDDEDNDENCWSDSDDEKLNVSITTSNRSKKLRTSYQQTKVNGNEYIRRLRAQFEKLYPKPDWVDQESSGENENSDDSDNEDLEGVTDGDINALTKILSTTYQYKDHTNSKLLPSKQLDILRLKDANISHPSKSAIQSLSFHPFKPLLLTGGYDRTLRIYHVDGKHNHLVTSLYLKGTPVQTCTFYVAPSQSNNFVKQEQKIFTGGRRRYMHSWDLTKSLVQSQSNSQATAKIDKISRLYGHEDTQRSFEKFKLAHFYNHSSNSVHGIVLLQGNNGWINILNATTGVWILGCKIEGVLIDFCIDYRPMAGNKFQTILIAVNTYGDIWEFDLNKDGKVIRKWKDEGGVGITKIEVGGGTNSSNFFPVSSNKVKSNRWLAIGSESGYVNVYDRVKDTNATPKPIAVLDQLTTTISSLQFSVDGQLLCIASRAVKDGLRLIHLPTCTVFQNWPTSGTPLGKVTSVAFSPRSEMLAVGNEQGKVRLWRLNHY